jgi:RNA polymerase sigma-70 factor (ECF subfamily)
METTFDLVWQHYPYLLRTARQWCCDYSTAEDVVQEAMLKAWRFLPKFRGDSSIKTWLFRIAHNCFFNTFKHKTKFVPMDGAQTQQTEAMQLRVLCADETIIRLETMLENMENQERSILTLKMQGYSNTEISTELKIKRNRVNIEIFRIRKKLKGVKRC